MEKNINKLIEKSQNIKKRKYLMVKGITEANREDIEKIYMKYQEEFEKLGIKTYLRECLNMKHEVND